MPLNKETNWIKWVQNCYIGFIWTKFIHKSDFISADITDSIYWLSYYPSLSVIDLSESTRRYPVSSHSALVYPSVVVHKRTSLKCSFLLWKSPAYLARLTWMVCLVVWVLWRINLCRLFNAKFCLYVYTFNQRFRNEYLVGKIFYKQDFIFFFFFTWLSSFNSSYFFVQPCLSQEGQNVIYFDVFEQFG